MESVERGQNCEVKIQFKNLNKIQLSHLFKAEKELFKAGITFDTGYNIGKRTRGWEFDHSLKSGIVSVKFIRTKEANQPLSPKVKV